MLGEEKTAAPVGLPAGGKLGEREFEEGFADEGAADVEDCRGELRGLALLAHGFDLVKGGGDTFFGADVGAYACGFATGLFDLGQERLVVGWVTGEYDDGVAVVDVGLAAGAFTRFDGIGEVVL